jgi:hypothetical protein
MKNLSVGAGTFCPLSILIFYILPCWEYLPISGDGPSPCCYRKIPQEPQIINVRKKMSEIHRMGRGSPGLRHFSANSGKSKVVI